jgi:hypothetical protein
MAKSWQDNKDASSFDVQEAALASAFARRDDNHPVWDGKTRPVVKKVKPRVRRVSTSTSIRVYHEREVIATYATIGAFRKHFPVNARKLLMARSGTIRIMQTDKGSERGIYRLSIARIMQASAK